MLRFRRQLGSATCEIVFTQRADGDFATLRDDDRSCGDQRLCERLFGSRSTEVTWLSQRHGSDVVEVTCAEAACGSEADALITDRPNASLVVRVADCVPVMLYGISSDGHAGVGAVHAGWRGLLAGVVANAAGHLRSMLGADAQLFAVVGPHIGSSRYEFMGPQRAQLADRFGAQVASITAWGTPAVDLSAACASALTQAGVRADHLVSTYENECARRWFSHRAGDAERMAAAIVLRPDAEAHANRLSS